MKKNTYKKETNIKPKQLLGQSLEEYRVNLVKDEKKNLSNVSITILGIGLVALGYYFWIGFWIINQQIIISVILILMGVVALYSGLFGRNVSELTQDELKKSMNARNKIIQFMLSRRK